MATPKLVFGAGSIGDTEKGFVHTWTTPEAVSSLLSSLKELGFDQLDSAANYPPGNPWNTDTLLGTSQAAKKGFAIDTKIQYDWDKPCNDVASIEASTAKSLRLLNEPSVNILYVHAFDRFTSIEETARGLHEQVAAGHCKKIGICNWQTVDIERYLDLCATKNYIRPSVIQANYNLLYRQAETTLLPLLRKHKINFYAYSPLAGGFLTAKVSFARDKTDTRYAPLAARTRWDGDSAFDLYGRAMDHDGLHQLIRRASRECEELDSSLAEASLRWLVFHSALGAGDGVILGASKLAQVQGNVEAVRKGPLPERLLEIVERLSREAQAVLRVPSLFKF